MAINRNTEVSEEIRDVFKGQPNVDGYIQGVGNSIIPVCDVNPKHARVAKVVETKTTSGTSGTIYTTPSDKDFYLTSLTLSMVKDSACDIVTNGQIGLRGYVNGVLKNICTFGNITLTAQDKTTSLNFTVPIKIDKDTAIQVFRDSSAAGTCITTGNISGYLVENIKA